MSAARASPSAPSRQRRRREALAHGRARALADAALRALPADPVDRRRRRHGRGRRGARRPRRPGDHELAPTTKRSRRCARRATAAAAAAATAGPGDHPGFRRTGRAGASRRGLRPRHGAPRPGTGRPGPGGRLRGGAAIRARGASGSGRSAEAGARGGLDGGREQDRADDRRLHEGDLHRAEAAAAAMRRAPRRLWPSSTRAALAERAAAQGRDATASRPSCAPGRVPGRARADAVGELLDLFAAQRASTASPTPRAAARCGPARQQSGRAGGQPRRLAALPAARLPRSFDAEGTAKRAASR